MIHSRKSEKKAGVPHHFSWKKGFVVVLIVILLIFVVIPPIALTILVRRHVNYRGEETPRYPLQGIYSSSDYGLEEIVHTFDTADGESLWCSEIQADEPKGVVIYLTGIMQPSITYFYGHAAWMQQNGYSSFLLEVRSHGSSTGKLIGLGYTEVADVQAVVEYIKSCEKYASLPMVIHGVSMGGAIAINAFGQIPEIDACIAMSPYASFETQLDLLLEQMKIPKIIRQIEAPILRQALKWNYGSSTVEMLSPYNQIQNAKGRPVLLIACSGDNSVPVENTHILQQGYPDAEVWIRDSWEHFIVKDCNFSKVIEDIEYCSRILTWISSCFADNGF